MLINFEADDDSLLWINMLQKKKECGFLICLQIYLVDSSTKEVQPLFDNTIFEVGGRALRWRANTGTVKKTLLYLRNLSQFIRMLAKCWV